jgi:hypothetical protein
MIVTRWSRVLVKVVKKLPSFYGTQRSNALFTTARLRGVNVLCAVPGEYKPYRWTEDFLLVSDKET